MVKRKYYKSFLEKCIELNKDMDICIWGARRTGRNLFECILENDLISKDKVHLIDRDLKGKKYILNQEEITVEASDKYLNNSDKFLIICAAENPNTARNMSEKLMGNSLDSCFGEIRKGYANFWFYIEKLVHDSSEKSAEAMEEYDNLIATLYSHQRYISDLIVDDEYMNVAPITTKIGCPIQCKYCPQDALIKAYLKRNNPIMELSFEAFKKMLERIPKTVIISFTGFVEPFANPECIDMLLYALDSGYIVRLFSTLYNVSIEDYERFKDYPNLKTLDIHLPDSNGNTRFSITESYRETLKYIVDNPPKYARLWTSCLGVNSKTSSEIRDIISVMGNPINSVHGLVYDNRLSHGSARLRCNRDCSRIDNPKAGVGMILPNGDVVACTQDWELQNVIGNIFEVSDWSELMESDIRKKFREALDNPEIDNICTYCELAVEIDQGDKI